MLVPYGWSPLPGISLKGISDLRPSLSFSLPILCLGQVSSEDSQAQPLVLFLLGVDVEWRWGWRWGRRAVPAPEGTDPLRLPSPGSAGHLPWRRVPVWGWDLCACHQAL